MQFLVNYIYFRYVDNFFIFLCPIHVLQVNLFDDKHGHSNITNSHQVSNDIFRKCGTFKLTFNTFLFYEMNPKVHEDQGFFRINKEKLGRNDQYIFTFNSHPNFSIFIAICSLIHLHSLTNLRSHMSVRDGIKVVILSPESSSTALNTQVSGCISFLLLYCIAEKEK